MRRARAGRLEPVLLVAERQTTRPRPPVGSDWSRTIPRPHSRWGCRWRRDWSGLSLAVGLSLVQSLHPRLCLKWAQRRVARRAQALRASWIETASFGTDRYVVIGIGINLGTATLRACARHRRACSNRFAHGANTRCAGAHRRATGAGRATMLLTRALATAGGCLP